MTPPFSTEQFLSVFRLYNTSIWPGQILLNALGILAIILCCRKNVDSVAISLFLAGLWLWTGIVYHIVFFSLINPAAFIFGGLCVVQGALFIYYGVVRRAISFAYRRDLKGMTGALLLVYALIVYPVIGYFLGHAYPYAPTFGAPCPATIFTFGLLLWTTSRVRGYLVTIPFLWTLVGSSAALHLGIREDIGLLISGVLGTALLTLPEGIWGRSRTSQSPDRTTE